MNGLIGFIGLASLIFGNHIFAESRKEFGNYHQNLAAAAIHSDLDKDYSLKEDLELVANRKSRRLRLTRTDQIPQERLAKEMIGYLEGYIQALIDANYYELNVLVEVKPDHTVILYNLPADTRIKASIIAFVQDISEVEKVEVGHPDTEVENRLKEREGKRKQVEGVWFPESTVLFQPIIANPWEPMYSIAYRWGDVLAKRQIAVSLGDVFPIFRWFNVLPWHGDLQIDIAACMWANFDMHPAVHPRGEWAELVTSDYILSIPLTYAIGNYAYRFRIYHISSHLGDEYIVNHPAVNRVNPSFEAIDFLTSFQATDGLRLYGGPGLIINSDSSYEMKQWYLWYGLEWRMPGLRYHYHRLYGAPFLALDMQNWQASNFRPSFTGQLGYEWSKLQGAGRKVRLFFEYHNGNSMGQFFRKHSEYVAVRGSWGF